MTYAYRFPDEVAWLIAADAEAVIADGKLQAYTHEYAIDVVGTLYSNAVYGEDGELIAAPEPLPGWHVNVEGSAPPAWDQFLVYVYQPRRIFAGSPGPVPP